MEKYVGNVVTVKYIYNYNSETTGCVVEENIYVWDERLLEPVTEEKNAEPEYFTGKVVCINDNRCDITKGKIYNFIDGEALNDAGDRFPYKLIHNVDELNDYYIDMQCDLVENPPQFIEIIE